MTESQSKALSTLYGIASDVVAGGGGILTVHVSPGGEVSYVRSPLSGTPPAVLLGQQAEILAAELEHRAPVTWVLAPTKAIGTLWAGRNLPALRKRQVFIYAQDVAGRRFRRGDEVVTLSGAPEDLIYEAASSVLLSGCSWDDVARVVRP